MLPPKLQRGNGIRVIAPSCSLSSITWLTEEFLRRADERMEDWGLQVSYGAHVREMDTLETSAVESRLADLHDAFRDPTVHAVITIRGGWNVNQLLARIDYDLIRNNPKILCGFSDITALGNAIYAKTGLVTYSGPNYYTFALGGQMQYTYAAFERCLFRDAPFAVQPSAHWTEERFGPGHEDLTFTPNPGPWVLQEGKAEGLLLGGNICTLNLLQGTPYMPDIRGSVLFLEDDAESPPRTVDRNLQSLLHQPDFGGVRGIVFGRFQTASGMTRELLEHIVGSKPELRGLPIIAEADFGHTHPLCTFPIGGRVRIAARGGAASIDILEH
jgi:muramoyltetrapeptide carboxypeptidase